MISKTLGTSSRKFARLRERHPRIGLFAQALYPLIVASSDDFGRLQGDAFTVKHSVWSTAPDDEVTFEAALSALSQEGLIVRYVVGDETFLEVVDFAPHQSGLHKRTASRFPEPSGKFPEIPGDSLLRELKGTELKGTECEQIAPPAPHRQSSPKLTTELGDRVRAFIEGYGQLYAKHRNGAHYHGRPSVDYQAACDLCRTWPDTTRLLKLAAVFLASDDQWIANSNRSIPVFASRASWCDDRLREWEKAQGQA